ncbi:hypothetical protein OIU85_023157 [Salix viminalis]|uniref:Uncharacterized protein n=1 Tax=Salix viminalis TaxID=40686 RepID=A0A9Q0Z8K5_SALVM|nr:hypothetical protein OIU85_023157 [Salix viminalis]
MEKLEGRDCSRYYRSCFEQWLNNRNDQMYPYRVTMRSRNVADRPTMASVVLMLSSSSLTLQIPSQPAFFMTSRTYQSDMSSSLGQNSKVTGQSSLSESEHFPLSKNEVSISQLYPR